MPKVSLVTATYNRADKLQRLYESICGSTYRDFEWIIVIDGSTDHTEELIKQWQLESDFPIIYKYQKNSGKHVAVNRLYEMANAEFGFTIDDDDEIMPDTLERGVAVIDSIPKEQRAGYWCIVGRCIDPENGEMVGRPYPANVNELSGRKLRKAVSCGGECCSFKNVRIMRKYQYPEVKGCSYFPEGNLWQRIDQDYKQYYTNEIFRVYHRNEGESLINFANTKESCQRRYCMYKFLLSKENTLRSKFLSRRYLAEIYKYRLFAERLGISEKEMYAGITGLNYLILGLLKWPCRLLQKSRHE